MFFANKDLRAQENKNPIIIEPVFPSNHNPDTKGYFDLNVAAGEKQVIFLRVTNNTDKEFSVSMNAANAYTYQTGGIIYEQMINSPNTILLEDAVKMTDYIEIEEFALISPFSSIEVPIKINIPLVEGKTILGGLLFTVEGAESKRQQEVDEGKANFIIKTNMIYAIAVKLNLPYDTPANFTFGEVGFTTEMGQGYFEVINNAQIIQDEVKGTYKVLDGGGNEVFNGKFGPFKMAPKTKIRYPFQWESESFKAGKYMIQINGSYEGKEINTSATFEIKEKEVKEYLEKNKNQNITYVEVKKGVATWIWVSVAIAFGIAMFIIGRRNNNKN